MGVMQQGDGPIAAELRCRSRFAPTCSVQGVHLSEATHVRCSFVAGHPGIHAAATIKWPDTAACPRDERIYDAHEEDRQLEPGTYWSVSTDFVHIRLRDGVGGPGDMVLELTFAGPYAPPEQSKSVPNVPALRAFVERLRVESDRG